MKVPLAWLADYVPLRLPPQELARRLTLAGIETTYTPGSSTQWGNAVVVGRVDRLEPHPNADRLRLATVDIGNGSRRVVCGAPNIEEGQRIAFAQVGAVLTEPRSGGRTALNAVTIRGVLSAGMVCSEQELGLGESQEGILVLPNDAPVGTPLREYLRDDVLEVEVKANRPDGLSVLGIAHEVAALTGEPLTEPTLEYDAMGPDLAQSLAVRIEEPALCSRYLAAAIRGVTVGPSPTWLQRRLLMAGQRPVNNIVDVTNYVMLEYGQPLHAFDLRQVRQGTIVVRQARRGERFVTLDGDEHILAPPILLIADPERAIALAGVMGGANSEMSVATTDVLLESANFHGINTRRTSTLLRTRTEASTRFEKTLNPDLTLPAIQRAAALILELAGGIADRGIASASSGATLSQPVRVRRRRLRQLMGTDYSWTSIAATLGSLGFEVVPEGAQHEPETFLATPPYWRSDVAIEEDVIEELARINGYDQVAAAPLAGEIPRHIPNRSRDLRDAVKDLLVGAGLQEVMTYSLVATESADHAVASSGGTGAPLRVANPMSRDQEVLRTSLRGSVLRVLSNAIRVAPEGVGVFETARIYIPRLEDLPEEREMLFCAMTGPQRGGGWSQDPAPLDFFGAKGVVMHLAEHLGIDVELERGVDAIFHPGRTAHLRVQGEPIGSVGELHPRVAASLGFSNQTVACFEIALDTLLALLPTVPQAYQPFSRYPIADRDLALIMDAAVPAGQVRAILESHPLVARATLFDLFYAGLPPGKKSLAYRVELQSSVATLAPEEISAAIAMLVSRLEEETGATLRS